MDLLLDGNPLSDPNATAVYANPNLALQQQAAAINFSLPASLFGDESFYDSPQRGVDVSIGTNGEVSVRGRGLSGDSLTQTAQQRAAARQSAQFSTVLASVPPIVWIGLAAGLLLRR